MGTLRPGSPEPLSQAEGPAPSRPGFCVELWYEERSGGLLKGTMASMLPLTERLGCLEIVAVTSLNTYCMPATVRST